MAAMVVMAMMTVMTMMVMVPSGILAAFAEARFNERVGSFLQRAFNDEF